MCSTGPFQFRWLKGYIYSSCYYHHQIGSINLTHCYHIFRGCVPEMFGAPYSVTYCIYIPGKPGVCFHYYCAVYDLKELDMFCLADRIRLFVHNSISLSSLCKLFWRQWTDKMPVRYILSRVWVRLSIFSQLSIIQYMGLCVFSLPISLVMIGRIYTMSYSRGLITIIKSEVWTVTHRSRNNGMHCMSLYSYAEKAHIGFHYHAHADLFGSIYQTAIVRHWWTKGGHWLIAQLCIFISKCL